MKAKHVTNNGGGVTIDRTTGNLLGAPNYPQKRMDLRRERKRSKTMAHMALACGDLGAAMGFMRCAHELQVQIDQTLVDEYKARVEGSLRSLIEAARPASKPVAVA